MDKQMRIWSTRKKDSDAPRGLFRHPGGGWGIRYTCGAGHIHQEKGNTLKTDALRAYHERRSRAHRDPSWCPRTERGRERERARATRAQEARRVTFRAYRRAVPGLGEAPSSRLADRILPYRRHESRVFGGWRTLAMVQRYRHLAPTHLQQAVERLVPQTPLLAQLRENFESMAEPAASVS